MVCQSRTAGTAVPKTVVRFLSTVAADPQRPGAIARPAVTARGSPVPTLTPDWWTPLRKTPYRDLVAEIWSVQRTKLIRGLYVAGWKQVDCLLLTSIRPRSAIAPVREKACDLEAL